MYRDSCIAHPPGCFIILIREDYIGICQNAPDPNCAAALLNYFTHWHDTLLNALGNVQAENAIRRSHNASLKADESADWKQELPEDLWVWQSMSQIRAGLNGIWKDDKIRASRQWLEDQKLLASRKHPTLKWKQTPQYQLNVNAVQSAVTAWGMARRAKEINPDNAPEIDGLDARQIEQRLAEYLASIAEKSGLDNPKNRDSVIRFFVSLISKVNLDRRYGGSAGGGAGAGSAGDGKNDEDESNPAHKIATQLLEVYFGRYKRVKPNSSVQKSTFRGKNFQQFVTFAEAGITAGNMGQYLDAKCSEKWYQDNNEFPSVRKTAEEIVDWVNAQRFAEGQTETGNGRTSVFSSFAKRRDGGSDE